MNLLVILGLFKISFTDGEEYKTLQDKVALMSKPIALYQDKNYFS